MTDLKSLSELAWKGLLDTKFEHHPVHTHYEGSTELEEDLLGIKGIGGMYVVDTKDGLVMLDAGSMLDIESAYVQIRKWRPKKKLHSVIFTHHHVDHVFAVKKFDEEAEELKINKPIVYSHSLTPEHFDRYKKTLGWNTAINKRQFAINVPYFQWPNEYRYPDITYDDYLEIKVGDCTFELSHARGETDDHTWIFIPEREILAPGDLFIWAVPNGGNPQKVQRYISDWSEALMRMSERNARLLLPGHGLPIYGKNRVKEALLTTAEFLIDIENQTLDLMNAGKSLNETYHSVKFSESLMSKPWLKPVYDDPKFLIRMIWRRYGGWWDGEYDRLMPDTREKEATEWIKLSGGLAGVLERSKELLDEGSLKLAAHLIEVAFYSAKDNKEVHEMREVIYREISLVQDSSMARNIYNHASLASKEIKRDLAEKTK